MSVAFTKEDSAETAAELLLPDRPISDGPNLVTRAGLEALDAALDRAMLVKPKGHDFVVDRDRSAHALSRHMSVTGG